MIKVLVDNGHGVETPGKRSPDGRLREYKYAREIASSVVSRLKERGYDAALIVWLLVVIFRMASARSVDTPDIGRSGIYCTSLRVREEVIASLFYLH